MKKIFLFAALGVATLSQAQNYPNNQGNVPPPQYPTYDNSVSNGNYGGNPNGQYGNNPNYGQYGNNPYGGQNNGQYGNYPNNGQYNGQYGGNNYNYYDDSFYNYAYNNFPQDYYYNYPTDYYPTAYYNSYYNDYRNSVIGINWNNFFMEFRLNPVQIQQITIINNRFNNYNSWYSYYGMNPNRWYYDRFYMLQRIMGANVYLVFQQRYYHGMSPMVYFQDYNINYYRRNYHCRPVYQNININTYYVKKDRFFVDNPRYSGFRNGQNTGSSFSSNSGASGNLRTNFWAIDGKSTSTSTGFRGDGNLQTDTNSGRGGFRNNSGISSENTNANSGIRNGGFRNENATVGEIQNNSIRNQNASPTVESVHNGGFRGGSETISPAPRMDRPTSGGFRNENAGQISPNIQRESPSFRSESQSGGGFRSGGGESRNNMPSSSNNGGQRGGFR